MTIPPRKKSTPQQEKAPTCQHRVHFSEHDEAFVATVGSFIGAGLQAGELCLVITTPAHQASLVHYLLEEKIDLAAAQRERSFFYLDAPEILTRFLVGEQLEPAWFSTEVEPLIESGTRDRRPVRIFEELAPLLWKAGKESAALGLEKHWNDLCQTHTFSLLCSYAIQSFAAASETVLPQIYRYHSQIVPSESYKNLSEQERLREFTRLQLKASALETMLAQRHEALDRLGVLAAIVESTDDAVLSKTLDGTITSWNSSAERIYGYTAEEIVGQHVTRIFPPNRWDEFEQIMGNIRRGVPVEHHETRRMRKDGTMLTVSVTISPVRDEAGTIVGASTIARDITDRKRLEAKSKRLFDSNLIGIFVIDAEGTPLETNQAFLDLLGYTRAEWQRSLAQSDPLLTSLTSFLRTLVRQAGQFSDVVEPWETELPQKDGKTLPVMVAVTRVEHTNTCIGFVLDMSERKALEQRKDAFIGMASHELKTPVTSLKGFLGLLRRVLVTQDNGRVLHYLTRMDAQIDKLTSLINDLLDISRMQTGQLIYREEHVEVDRLVQEVVESIQETTQTHRIQIKGQTGAVVFGDSDRLGQVLINLLNNAIKYSPQADTVLVHLSLIEPQQVLISVQDFGPGIAREHHNKIFERFYQVIDSDEKTYPGLGIGLAISYDIVKRHAGQIWVESEKGEGATFHLRLPCAGPQQLETEVDGQYVQ